MHKGSNNLKSLSNGVKKTYSGVKKVYGGTKKVYRGSKAITKTTARFMRPVVDEKRELEKGAADYIKQYGAETARLTEKGIKKSTKNAYVKTKRAVTNGIKRKVTGTNKGTLSTKDIAGKAAKTATKTKKAAKHGIKTTARSARRASKISAQATKQTAKISARAAKTTAKISAQGAKMAAKTTAKTAQAAIKAGVKTAQIATQVAAKVAAAAVKVGAAVTKAVVAVVTKIVTALIAAIAAGGWVILLCALVVVVIISLFSWLFPAPSEPFSVSNTLYELREEYASNYESQAEGIIAAVDADEGEKFITVEVDGAPSSWQGAEDVEVYNIRDVLCVYVVRIFDEPEMKDEKRERILRETFWDMNEISVAQKELSTTITQKQATDEGGNLLFDEDGEPVMQDVANTTITLAVTTKNLTWEDAAALYNIEGGNYSTLKDFATNDASYEMIYTFAGVGMDGSYGGEGAEIIVNINIPPGTQGAAIIDEAKLHLGKSYSTMDCSKFVQTTYLAMGVQLPRTAAEQARWCVNNNVMIGKGQLQPGDLIFWRQSPCSCGGACNRYMGIHHVGIYVGDGYIIDSTPSKSGVSVQKLWETSSWKIIGYARPMATSN